MCPVYGCIVLYLDCLECEEKRCRKMENVMNKKYKKIVIGVDQSYKNTGISIAADGELKKVTSIRMEKLKNNSKKREKLRATLEKVIKANKGKSDELILIFERIRLQSKGFININYIKSMGALDSIMIDVCDNHEIPVYSVDTRSWKSRVVGTSKPMKNDYGVPDEKYPTIVFVKDKGFEESILIEITGRKLKGTFERDGKRWQYNDDAADSAGISLYGFLDDSILHEEN
jgi:hypothetical protein